MKYYVVTLFSALLLALFPGCDSESKNISGHADLCGTVENPVPVDSLGNSADIIFLHHSTGGGVWGGGVPEWFADYNDVHGTSHIITERAYPSGDPYPWDNYPYDYYNI